MRRIDATVARAVVVDGLGAASEVEAVRGRWKLETRNGRRVPAPPLACGIAYGGGAQDNRRMNSEACEGCDEGSPALPPCLRRSGALSSGAGNWGLCSLCPMGRWWDVMLAIPLTRTSAVESAMYERRVAGDRQWFRRVCASGVRWRGVCGHCVLATVCGADHSR
jgi:hypothetical protein